MTIAEVRSLIEEARAMEDEGLLADLHQLAIDILNETAPTSEFRCTVEWHEGCHCHGSTQTETFTDTTLDGLSWQLVNCKHTEETHLGNTYRYVRLNYTEEHALRTQYKKWFAWGAAREALLEKVTLTGRKIKTLETEINVAMSEYQKLHKDLTPEAQTKRSESISELAVCKKALEAELVGFREELSRHEGSRP